MTHTTRASDGRSGTADGLRARTGPVVRGRYVLGRTLGETATSAVIEAVDRRMRRAVAVKLFEPETDGRGQLLAHAEARLGSLEHPNLCAVLDVDEQNGIPIVILERLQGETLADVLARGERLEIAHALELFMQILSALDIVHERGIVHRDVKPANVFLVPRAGCLPVVKLFDFAMSLDLRAAVPGTCMVVGTPAYMAPEQANGEVATIDGRADLYAVGIMLFEAVIGSRPFAATNYDALVGRGPARGPIDIRQIAPEMPSQLAAVITRALSPSRERRFGSAREMQNALCSEPPSGVQRAEAQTPAGHQSATRIEVPVPRRARAASAAAGPPPAYCSATLPVRFAPTMADGEDTVTLLREV